jgi:hypothetical protein
MSNERSSQIDRAESILNKQSEDQPIIVDEDGTIHPSSEGNRGLAIRDAKGEYEYNFRSDGAED